MMSDHGLHIVCTQVGEDANAIMVRSGGALFEIPRRFILGIEPLDGLAGTNAIRLTLAADAQVLQRVESGPADQLVVGIRDDGPTCYCACACNCACNCACDCACACSEETHETLEMETGFRRPLTEHSENRAI
jgi:hypothetical protein